MIKNILVILILLSALNGFSQQLIVVPIDELPLQMRVKQVDEFMARFNFEESIEGNLIENLTDTVLRTRYLYSLFDRDCFQPITDTLKEEITQFIEKIIADDIHLCYEDTTWIAELICKVGYNGKSYILSLFLKPEQIREFEYKWVIVDVKGDLLNIEVANKEQNGMFSPAEHEIGFMSLPSTINQNSKNIAQYSFLGFHQDRLSAFNALIYLGLLKMHTVQSVDLHFYTVPDYIFTVSRVEKSDSYNTGWLITSLKKATNRKKDY